ncbi:MAG: non-heme iron oxygenase ferredoxin subunit [Anaerolineae bacterium]|jgi:3-phenylpropionate/trans-cinnamate dioxygenase ferredoxin subunit|nr:non-heme iron oxygenase ferredoxin subunit [Anaerolineae bacterium]
MSFVKIATVTEIPPGMKKIVEVAGILIVVANIDGQFYAVEDVCTHDGGPLGEGKLDGCQLICPRHGARFDVRTGAALTMPAVEAAPTYAVRVEGDDVLVEAY